MQKNRFRNVRNRRHGIARKVASIKIKNYQKKKNFLRRNRKIQFWRSGRTFKDKGILTRTKEEGKVEKKKKGKQAGKKERSTGRRDKNKEKKEIKIKKR